MVPFRLPVVSGQPSRNNPTSLRQLQCVRGGLHLLPVFSILLSSFIGAAQLPAEEPATLLLRLNEAFLSAVQAESPPPALTSRNLAIFHVAMAQGAAEARDAKVPVPIVVASTGYRLGTTLFPANTRDFDALLRKTVGRDGSAPAAGRALALGRETAEAWLESRAADGSSTTVHYVPSDAFGQWRRTPPTRRPPELPHWGKVTPFLLPSIDLFRPPPPPTAASLEYVRASDQVRRLGGASSTERTADQALAAKFWSDFSYTPGPPGHWNQIACRLIAERKIALLPAARLLAQLNLAMADAGIACWDAKYHYNSWRPLTAIRHAAENANDTSAPDAAWDSLLPSPPHPEYPSGHACFSGAAATVLAGFFGTDAVRFTATSVSTPGVTRTYPSFSACAQEIASSRVWAGIHFSYAGQAGLVVGGKIGRLTLAKGLPPRPTSAFTSKKASE